jgi:hypothetical protein
MKKNNQNNNSAPVPVAAKSYSNAEVEKDTILKDNKDKSGIYM